MPFGDDDGVDGVGAGGEAGDEMANAVIFCGNAARRA